RLLKKGMGVIHDDIAVSALKSQDLFIGELSVIIDQIKILVLSRRAGKKRSQILIDAIVLQRKTGFPAGLCHRFAEKIRDEKPPAGKGAQQISQGGAPQIQFVKPAVKGAGGKVFQFKVAAD